MHNYDDIIDIKEINLKHPRMSIGDRAAQFSPFAALTGYDEEIKETSRITSRKRELSSDEIEILNNKINQIKYNLPKEVIITYFIKDIKKSGGRYQTDKLILKNINYINKELVFNNIKVNISNILDIKF